MIDPMASMAFTVYSSNGGYAVLLGSGVSRSSGIPTGWEITKELIKKLASLSGPEPEDPVAWYQAEFNQEPDYSVLLSQLAKGTADRNLILRSYFEPTPEEFEAKAKVATPAHHAIAELARKGYIKVIVTTNFDQLMEKALTTAGVTPNVVSNADQAKGMLPLARSKCTVIKVHGDYTDTRIKNTQEELASYEEGMNKLLDQVFDEYGLIVCGWSGEWDEALRTAIERGASRRFSTFWSALGEVSTKAEAICRHREAQIVKGLDADQFFDGLKERVEALEAIDASRHPLTKKMAVATAKKYIAEDRYRSKLHDLFMGEAERVVVTLREDKYSKKSYTGNWSESAASTLKAYEADVDVLLGIMIAGGFWGNDSRLLIRCLERVAEVSESQSSEDALANLAVYPVRLLLYGCGVAAVASNQEDVLGALLSRSRTSLRGRSIALWQRVGDGSQYALLEPIITCGFQSESRSHFPVCQHIYNKLQPEFREYVSGDREFKAAFHRFEYLAGMAFADQERESDVNNTYTWGPRGLFLMRGFTALANEVQKEIDRDQADFPMVKAGAFKGSIDRLKSVKPSYDADLKGYARAHGFGLA